MKLMRFIPAILLCSILFISCTNTETNEELQLFENQDFFTVDTGGGENPPIPPDDPDA